MKKKLIGKTTSSNILRFGFNLFLLLVFLMFDLVLTFWIMMSSVDRNWLILIVGKSMVVNISLISLFIYLLRRQYQFDSRVSRIGSDLNHLQQQSVVILESMADGVIVIDSTKQIVMMNENASLMLEIDLVLDIGKPYTHFWNVEETDGKQVSQAQRPIELALIGQRTLSIEYEYVTHSGKHFPVSISAAPVEMEDGTMGCVLVFRDRSKEKQHLDALMKKTQELEQLNRIMVGREIKMHQLKKEIKRLKEIYANRS